MVIWSSFVTDCGRSYTDLQMRENFMGPHTCKSLYAKQNGKNKRALTGVAQ